MMRPRIEPPVRALVRCAGGGLPSLPAGTLRLGVAKAGFPPVEYGQVRAMQPGRALVLRENQTLDRIDIRLLRGASINGRVVDGYGEPLEGFAVQVWQPRFGNGRTELRSADEVQTARLGRHHAFLIKQIFAKIDFIDVISVASVAKSPHRLDVHKAM